MPKALSISGMVVAALIMLVFGLDLAIGFPFWTLNPVMDVGFLVCALILAYASWATWREQR
jgi:hypothetical protein